MISIHASLTGGDGILDFFIGIFTDFNPRLPHGRRRSESDSRPGDEYFNPRLPHGRRRKRSMMRQSLPVFQSTPPSREATRTAPRICPSVEFQSTPPSREATAKTTNSNPLQPVVFVILYSNPWYLIALIYKILVLNTSYSFFQVRTLQHIYERYTFAPLISYLANYSIRNLILCYIDIIIGKITR